MTKSSLYICRYFKHLHNKLPKQTAANNFCWQNFCSKKSIVSLRIAGDIFLAKTHRDSRWGRRVLPLTDQLGPNWPTRLKKIDLFSLSWVPFEVGSVPNKDCLWFEFTPPLGPKMLASPSTRMFRLAFLPAKQDLKICHWHPGWMQMFKSLSIFPVIWRGFGLWPADVVPFEKLRYPARKPPSMYRSF